MQEPVTDGIGEGGLADVLVPLGGRQLARDDRRPHAVAILEDLQDVAPLLILERGERPIIDEQDNAEDGFVMTSVDEQVFTVHGTQLVGHFLIDRGGTVRWTSLEAERDLGTLATFPGPAEILAAVRSLAEPVRG